LLHELHQEIVAFGRRLLALVHGSRLRCHGVETIKQKGRGTGETRVVNK
jgi:hypothetical protein